ncbi:hypothetical protein BDV96DRAFT_582747 [Lophiotrema nucula]|uniref:Uncharacterized protein n=1 Tax=Lophiotrema nucula TaxID=690887 RepID=A0A6A5YWP9_9PLEO|nr:hypothetical protein BDV96DRAFT_582747 [Lophiotrema nucula]
MPLGDAETFWSDSVEAWRLSLVKTKQHTSAFSRTRDEDDPNKALYRIVSPIGGPCGTLSHEGELSEQSILGCYYVAMTWSSALRVSNVSDTFPLDDRIKDLQKEENVFSTRYAYGSNNRNGLGIMLVRPSVRGCCERVAVGYIHALAWAEAEPQGEKILLI